MTNLQEYTIKSGDTLIGIAKKFNTTYQNLQQINGIANANKIYAGQKIKVPGGASPTPAPVRTQTVTQSVTQNLPTPTPADQKGGIPGWLFPVGMLALGALTFMFK